MARAALGPVTEYSLATEEAEMTTPEDRIETSTRFGGAHVLSMRQWRRDDHEVLFAIADQTRGRSVSELKAVLPGRILAAAFFENSTRTRIAHESAILRLGGSVTGFADASVTRALDFTRESLEDTVRMLALYADVIVIRHPETGVPARLAAHSTVPLINAGDGVGEHPTQAFVDLYTVQQRFGTIDGVKILFVGDLRMRAVRSLLLGLQSYRAEVLCAAPSSLMPEPALLKELREGGHIVEQFPDLASVLPKADVLYISPGIKRDEIAQAGGKRPTPPEFRVTRRLLEAKARDSLLVLHPLPRDDDLATDVDETPFNGYWQEAMNGVIVRMALLRLMLER